jgi:death on curing protein
MNPLVSLQDAHVIHTLQLMLHGGTHGLRDQGLLESALMRPHNGYYVDVVEEAAALWESLIVNHPFVDGNKRTAYALMCLYLKRNGIDFLVSPKEAEVFILTRFEEKNVNHQNLTKWLRFHLEK